MPPKKAAEKQSYRFALSPQDASLTDAQVRKLLGKATTEAEEAAKEDGFAVKARSGAEGGFLGIGEITILLTLAAKSAMVAKIVAAAGVAADLDAVAEDADLATGFAAVAEGVDVVWALAATVAAAIHKIRNLLFIAI